MLTSHAPLPLNADLPPPPRWSAARPFATSGFPSIFSEAEDEVGDREQTKPE